MYPFTDGGGQWAAACMRACKPPTHPSHLLTPQPTPSPPSTHGTTFSLLPGPALHDVREVHRARGPRHARRHARRLRVGVVSYMDGVCMWHVSTRCIDAIPGGRTLPHHITPCIGIGRSSHPTGSTPTPRWTTGRSRGRASSAPSSSCSRPHPPQPRRRRARTTAEPWRCSRRSRYTVVSFPHSPGVFFFFPMIPIPHHNT